MLDNARSIGLPEFVNRHERLREQASRSSFLLNQTDYHRGQYNEKRTEEIKTRSAVRVRVEQDLCTPKLKRAVPPIVYGDCSDW